MRRLLGFLCVLFVPGCFDSPPEYTAADRIPPVIDSRGVEPPLTGILGYQSPRSIDFVIPFRSDDRGDDLWAIFVLDLPPRLEIVPQTLPFLGAIQVAPDSRPFTEQTGRSVFFSWSHPSLSGCHTVTAILSHDFPGPGLEFPDPEDIAQVTWTLDFLDSSASSPNCSAANQVSQ